MKTFRTFALIFGPVLFVGCSTYPLGLSQAEWNQLTPAQQAEYRKLDRIQSAQQGRKLKSDAESIQGMTKSAGAEADGRSSAGM